MCVDADQCTTWAEVVKALKNEGAMGSIDIDLERKYLP